ncbi:MAG TPA: hypothetical protein VL307_16455 [Chitinophagaceae bacterium]|nr:hypothetical protein [Chitinophagaceae bacterium]
MPSYRHSLNSSITLDHVHCIDEGDGPGLAEPYLWTLFFKIDGDSVEFAGVPAPVEDGSLFTLRGTVTTVKTYGGHRNLRNTDDDPVDEGEDVAIPPAIGHWETVLVPIPVADPVRKLVKDTAGILDLPGTMGVVCILMEEDNLSDSSALAGYNAFCATFEAKMNEYINSRTSTKLKNKDSSSGQDEEKAFQEGMRTAISNAIKSAIIDDLNILELAWNYFAGADQQLGSGSFQYNTDILETYQQIPLKARWKEGVSVGGPFSFFEEGPGNFIQSAGDWEIYGNIAAQRVPDYVGSFGPMVQFSPGDMAIRDFIFRADAATKEGFVGGFPNFYTAVYGRSNVGGTIFMKPGCSVLREIPLKELNNPPLNDFIARFRAVNVYARDKAFVGGFPNFHDAEKIVAASSLPVNATLDHHTSFLERTMVCGTVLIKPGCAEYHEVPLAALGNPILSDIGARFRATQDYARNHGFVGGFPDFFHINRGNGILCGTVLITHAAAEWRDVLLWIGPA